jgi:hypothetical protein
LSRKFATFVNTEKEALDNDKSERERLLFIDFTNDAIDSFLGGFIVSIDKCRSIAVKVVMSKPLFNRA